MQSNPTARCLFAGAAIAAVLAVPAPSGAVEGLDDCAGPKPGYTHSLEAKFSNGQPNAASPFGKGETLSGGFVSPEGYYQFVGGGPYAYVYSSPRAVGGSFPQKYEGRVPLTVSGGEDWENPTPVVYSYSFPVSPGPNRAFTVIAQTENGQWVGGAADACLDVRAGFVSFETDRKHRRNGQTVRFTGELGGPIVAPVLVKLQARVGKKWQTFKVLTSDRDGAVAGKYRFTSTTRERTYRFRAAVPEQAAYPYLAGRSKKVKVRVTP